MDNNCNSVYLAGRIDGDSLEDAVYWRDFCSNHLTNGAVDVIDPLRGTLKMTEAYPAQYKINANLDWDFLYRRDLYDIDNSQALLVNLDNVQEGAGTLFEIGYAYNKFLRQYQYTPSKGLPIYMFGGTDELRSHMFIQRCGTVTTCDEALKMIINRFGSGKY